MIEVVNISKTFDHKKVLDNVSVKFERGKTNLVIGRSGSGKTVLMKIISGLLEPDEGHVYFDGRDFNKMSFKQKKELRQEIGMLFQGSALFDSLNVEENVMFPLNLFTDLSYKEKIDKAGEELDKLVGTRTRVIKSKLKEVTELPEAEAKNILGDGNSYADDNV